MVGGQLETQYLAAKGNGPIRVAKFQPEMLDARDGALCNDVTIPDAEIGHSCCRKRRQKTALKGRKKIDFFDPKNTFGGCWGAKPPSPDRRSDGCGEIKSPGLRISF